MAKKTKAVSFNFIYLIGMIVTIVGFICPMFDLKVGTLNGFNFIDFGKSSFVSIGALLIFIGAVAGVIASFMPMLKNYKLLCLIVTLLGGVVLLIGFASSGKIYQSLIKGLFKFATYGFYIVLAGWIVSLVGYFIKK